MKTAARIAWREARASSARFIFVVLAVALGVGALTGVRGFSNAFRHMLLTEARTIMAADLTVRIFGSPSPAQTAAMDKLASRGVVRTDITEALSMVTSSAVSDPVLVSVKSVDPARYPFYGALTVEPAARLDAQSAYASPDAIERLNASVGDVLTIGGQPFRLAASIAAEPDRMNGSLNVGPRVMITREGLERTGLIGLGSRAAQRFLFKVPAERDVQPVKEELKRIFPEARINDYRETQPQITQGLDRATTFLSLITLIALIVGALGVGTAMHAHIQQKLDSIAVMKSLGARSMQVIRIYGLQTLMLGALGGLLGVLAGLAVQFAFPVLIERYFQIRPAVSLDLLTAGQGLAAGVLTTLLFTIPPLLGVRQIKPNLVLRRDVEPARRAWAANAVAAALIAAGVFGLSMWLTTGGGLRNALRVSTAFVGGLLVSLVLLAAVAWVLLRILRAVNQRSSLHLRPTLRHGIANVYRPGSQAPAVLTALGIGVMFTLSIYLLQRSVLAEMKRNAPPGMANVFLLDVTPAQRDDVLAILKAHRGTEKPPELIATVSARLVNVDGKPVAARLTRTRPVTISPELKTTDMPEVSISERASKWFNIPKGSVVEWDAYGTRIRSRITKVHQNEMARLSGMVDFMVAPGVLERFPTVWYGAARVQPNTVPALQRALYRRYPTITVINMADVLGRIEEVVDQIAVVIRFISLFAIIAGITILASSVAGTRFRRVREVVILKTLGATKSRIVRIFSAEFLILGTVAGLIGSALATGFSVLLLKRFLNAPFHFDWAPNVVSVVLTALLAAATGWLTSWRILRQKPMEVLRNE